MSLKSMLVIHFDIEEPLLITGNTMLLSLGAAAP